MTKKILLVNVFGVSDGNETVLHSLKVRTCFVILKVIPLCKYSWTHDPYRKFFDVPLSESLIRLCR